jgi:hypothetical protein
MDVPLRRTVRGCVWWPSVIASLGVAYLLAKLSERAYIARMDDNGFTTRGGKQVAWHEVTAVRREQTTLNGQLANDSLRLKTERGTVYLPLFRTDDPQAVYDYAVRRLPTSVKIG